MEKIKYANIEQIRKYTDKNGNEKYKYMVHQEKWNNEKKKYEGWECITIYSNEIHLPGDLIAYKWNYDYKRYNEEVEKEELPF